MKGGKAGRKRRPAGGGGKRKGAGRTGAAPNSGTRKWADAPKKGDKGKPLFGGSRSTGEE